MKRLVLFLTALCAASCSGGMNAAYAQTRVPASVEITASHQKAYFGDTVIAIATARDVLGRKQASPKIVWSVPAGGDYKLITPAVGPKASFVVIDAYGNGKIIATWRRTVAPLSVADTITIPTSRLATPAPPPATFPPPPATQPPPPATSPPAAPSSGAYVAVVSDSFTTYSDTKALLAAFSVNAGGTGPWNASKFTGLNAQLVELDRSLTCDGHPTMKYNQPGGTISTPQVYTVLPNGAALSRVWYRVTLRFSPGWTTKGTLTNSANAYKLFGWGFQGFDGSGRLEITNTTQYELYEGVANAAGKVVSNLTYGYPGNITTEWTDGAWRDYVLLVDHTTTTALAKVWMGVHGTVPTLRGSVTNTMLDGSRFPSINSMMTGMNFNQVRAGTQSQSVHICRIEVIDGVKHPNPFGL